MTGDPHGGVWVQDPATGVTHVWRLSDGLYVTACGRDCSQWPLSVDWHRVCDVCNGAMPSSDADRATLQR